MRLRYPPITNFGQKVLTKLLLTGTTYNRPKSIRHERLRWHWHKRWIVFTGLVCIFLWQVVQNLDNIVSSLPGNCNPN